MLEYVVTPTLRYERLLLNNAEKEIAELSAPQSEQTHVRVPVEQLEHWAEYWNGSANEKAMSDALAELVRALEPFATEYQIAEDSGELQHWPESEVARCKAAYDALAKLNGAEK